MRRFVLRGLSTLLVLLVLFSAGFYLIQAGRAKRQGEEYAVRQLPGDLARLLGDLVGSVGSDGSPEPSPEPAADVARRTEPVEPPPPPAPAPDRTAHGRDLLDAGDFRGALDEWDRLLRREWSKELAEDVETARLCAVVAERLSAPAPVPVGDTTRVALRSGATMEGRVDAEDARGIHLALPDGSSVVIPADQIVARKSLGPDARAAALEDDYRDRLARIVEPRGPGLLDLAGWCSEQGLRGHLAFLLGEIRKAEKSEGAVLGAFLAEAYPSLDSWQQKEVAGVLARNYRNTPAARDIVLARAGVDLAHDDPGSGVGSRPERAEPAAPRRPMSDEFLARVDRAKALYAEGKKEYEQAMPDMADRAEHRKKGLEVLTEARDLFEQLLEERPSARWLERYLQEVYVMHRWLRKDTPLK